MASFSHAGLPWITWRKTGAFSISKKIHPFRGAWQAWRVALLWEKSLCASQKIAHSECTEIQSDSKDGMCRKAFQPGLRGIGRS